MRKTKKALASLAIAGMVLSIAPMSVFGATDVTRISDADRVGTAIAIAANGWTSADSVIVVPADDANIVDALAAAPLAGQLNAPILVTYKGALDTKVQQKIVDLKAKNVYAVGALSADTVASLKAISGVTVTALQGADRTETAAKVAAQLTNVKGSFVVAYNGTADAMSAASYAAANGYSILVENPDGTLPANEAAYKGAKQYTVGGQAKLDGATALAGADRYATNDAVLNGLDYKYDTVYVANGESLVDALAGASLAAKTNSPIVLADATKAATGVNDNVTASTKVIALGGVGAVPEAVRTQVGHATPTGTASVQSVSAISASSIKVTFGAAVADTSKVTFNVTRSATPMTLTAAWNDAKTEATLSYSANLPEDTYAVSVKNDTTDLGSGTVAITKQKVAQIKIVGDTLAVAAPVGATPGKGYMSYQVLDQYGVDITSSSLANSSNINWSASIGNPTANKGLLTVETYSATVPLTTYTTTMVTAICADSNVTSSQTVKVALSQGTLSNVTLNTLSNADGKVLTDGDTLNKFYIDYTALDISGNPTNNKTLVDNGLLSSDSTPGADTTLYSSNPNLVKAVVVEDPTDANKAVIEVTVVNSGLTPIFNDTPVTLTAMTKTGKSSTLNVTLKKASTLNTITIMSPSQDVAEGDKNVVIPFVAYDQDGAALTKYSDIYPMVSNAATSGLDFVKNADGTLKIQIDLVPTGTTVYQLVTTTGKSSLLTIKAQKPVYPDSLAIDTSKVKQYMQLNAVQKMDLGANYAGLSVKDQYGRVISLTKTNLINGKNYAVRTTGSAITIDNNSVGGVVSYDLSGNAITATGTTPWAEAYNGNVLALHAKALGSQTVTFELWNLTDNVSTGITKSMTLTVVKDSDITDVTSNTVGTVYAPATFNPNEEAYTQGVPDVFGKLKNGGLVKLADASIVNKTLSGSAFAFAAGGANAGDIIADRGQFASGATEATGIFTTTVLVNNKVSAVTTPLKASIAAPAANSIEVAVKAVVKKQGHDIGGIDTGLPTGVSISGDTITVAVANVGTITGAGKSLFEYGEALQSTSNVYFYGLDQYGNEGSQLTSAYITPVSGAAYAINPNTGVLTGAGVSTFNLTVVSANGLVKTMKFVIK